jgi:hypothetical protein
MQYYSIANYWTSEPPLAFWCYAASTMVFANDIRRVILELADQRGSDMFSSAEVARLIDSENWVKQVEQVELVAEALVRQGQIISTTAGSQDEKNYTKTSLLAKG